MRPSEVYPEHTKRAIMEHIRGHGWKPVAFRVPAQKDEYYLGRDYTVHPSHVYTGKDPRIIVETILGEYVGILRREDNVQ